MPYAVVANLRLYYETHGPALAAPSAPPPLVLIHGLGSSTRDWSMQVEAFAEARPVVTLDLRGHGRSDKPRGPYSIPLFARDVAALLDHLGAPPAHVVGLSMGGMVTFQLAVSHPQHVRSLTVVNSVPSVLLDRTRDQWFYRVRRATVQATGMRRVARLIARRLFVKPEQEDLRQQFIERWRQNDKAAYLASMDAFIGWSVADKLGDVPMPALLVSADEDYTPVVMKERAVAQMPRAELAVVEDSRHATPVEHPERFNAIVRDFMARVEAGGPIGREAEEEAGKQEAG